MEYFKISFGSGKALNYVEYGRDKNICCEGYLIEDAGKEEAEEQEQRDSWTLWSKDFEERNDVM